MAGERGQDFHVLALTGGGYRGLYTAHVLERLEAAAGKPVGQCFDLIAGTSIGGVLALAIAFEVPMQRVVSVFREHGERIFPKKGGLAGAFSSRYDSEPLREVISLLLPASTTLAEAKHALAIPALNLTAGKQQILKTRHNAEWTRDLMYSIHDVALATAAAPIYFPIAEIDNQLFSDGGLFANAPDLVALHEANKFFGQLDERIRMLSIGTLSSTYSISAATKRDKGVASWLKPPNFPLIQTILAAQQQFSIQIVAHRLADRHVRIDNVLSETVMECVGLDKADAAAQQALLGLAAKDITDLLGTEQIKQFLQHTPQKWLIKDEV